MKTALRRTVVVLLIGFVAGGIAGGVSLHLKGKEVREVGAQEQSSFAATCLGGTTPYVVITWPERMESIISGLERSEDGGSWVSVGANATDSKLRYADAGVSPGKTYHYHVVWSGIEVVRPISVSTAAADCSSTP